jgi:drug/metabolite transporter (DMT)-like permease
MQIQSGSAALFVVSVLTGELRGFSLGQVSLRSWLGLLYLITFGSLVGFVSYGWLLQNAPISLVSTYAYVNPVVAVFLGWMFAGEALNARIGIATAIIVGAVILINWARQAPVRKEVEEVVPLEIE